MGSYRVEITQAAKREIRDLPGHIRPLVFKELKSLERNAQPHTSKGMRSTQKFKIPESIELRRIRIDRWRIVYVVEKESSLITVLAIRKRPPYQYEDLAKLLEAE